LLLCWYFIMSSPEPLRNKDKKVKVTNQSLIAILLPEPRLIANKKLKLTTCCHHCAKPLCAALVINLPLLNLA
jgi:hypothetical protein